MLRVLITTPRFEVCHQEHRRSDGKGTKDFYFIRKPDAVLIVPYTDDNIFLLRVNRPYIDGPSIELPGGRIEAGEEPLVAAGRELREECGFGADRWCLLHTTYPLPSVTTERIHIFSAELNTTTSGVVSQAARSEGITETLWVPFGNAHRLAMSGAMKCAADALALLVFLSQSKEGSAR